MAVDVSLPPTRYTLFSFAASESTCVDSPGIRSAYAEKKLVPYGELKHSCINDRWQVRERQISFTVKVLTFIVDFPQTVNESVVCSATLKVHERAWAVVG